MDRRERIKIRYKENEELYSREGFTLPIAEKILKVACLWVTDAYHLFCYAKKILSGGTYLEIGSFDGGSLLCVYEGILMAGTFVNLIAIEPKETARFLQNIESLQHFRHIKFTSDKAINLIDDESVDLLFIDGNHYYKQARCDILNYWPKIKTGGILLGHDYLTTDDHEHVGHNFATRRTYGVKRAADEIFGKRLIKLTGKSIIFKVTKNAKV